MKIAVAGGTGVVGRHVVRSLTLAGHDAVLLSRAAGIDLMNADGLADALANTDAVVDVSSRSTTAAKASIEFFGTVTRNLLAAEQQAGVAHHVALSIVGAARVGAAYYAGKRLQEELVATSKSGWTILRATQFHEFAAQLAARGDRILLVPRMQSQPIAAAEVGAALADIAVGSPRGMDVELAGPRVENVADMVRRYVAATGRRGRVVEVPLPGAWGRAMRDGSLIASAGAQLGSQSFAGWLAEITTSGEHTLS